MKTMLLATIDNRSIPGLGHCYGTPFLCSDYDDAAEAIYKSLGDNLPKVNLELFDFVVLADYHLFGSEEFNGDPFGFAGDFEMERCTVCDLLGTAREHIREDFLKNDKNSLMYVEGSLYKDEWDWCVENNYTGKFIPDGNLIADIGPCGDEGIMTGVGFYDDLEVKDEI